MCKNNTLRVTNMDIVLNFESLTNEERDSCSCLCHYSLPGIPSPFCVLISETNYFVCRWVIVFLTPAPCTVLIIQQLTRQWKNKQLCFPKYWLAAVWSWSNAAKWDICCSHKSLSPPSPLVFRDVQSLLHTKPPGIPAVLLLKRSTVHNFLRDALSFRSFPSFNKLLWDLF